MAYDTFWLILYFKDLKFYKLISFWPETLTQICTTLFDKCLSKIKYSRILCVKRYQSRIFLEGNASQIFNIWYLELRSIGIRWAEWAIAHPDFGKLNHTKYSRCHFMVHFLYRLSNGIMLVLLFAQFCAKYFGRIQNCFRPKGQMISKYFCSCLQIFLKSYIFS